MPDSMEKPQFLFKYFKKASLQFLKMYLKSLAILVKASVSLEKA
jgi:hypothetical protein